MVGHMFPGRLARQAHQALSRKVRRKRHPHVDAIQVQADELMRDVLDLAEQLEHAHAAITRLRAALALARAHPPGSARRAGGGASMERSITGPFVCVSD